MNHLPDLKRPDIFRIDDEIKNRYPSFNVGIAIVRGVEITKFNEKLWQRINEFALSQITLTNERINSYPEVQSYRKVYKEMGIDWHSRRPSPEALLRRISKGKSLYQINSCVDAYNLVVMKTRVSIGAFNQDAIAFPTVLRFAKTGEKIQLLGDDKVTQYKSSEIAYFDQKGGYNIDLNYRDSQRTAVTESTKNIFINIEGLYEITRDQIEKTLNETIVEITKYCGGVVNFLGMVAA